MARDQSGSTLTKVIVLVAIVVVGVVLWAVPASQGYKTRGWVSDAIGEAAPMREGVFRFRQSQGKWPGVADAAKFKVDRSQLKRARSIEYDPANRAVVITMDPEQLGGQRFAFYGEESPEGPGWSCRRIDIEAKHLPASCR